MLKLEVFYLITFAVSVIASLSFRESSGSIASPFIRIGRAEKYRIHEVTIAIKQNNLDEIHRLLDDISNPKSPNFLKHLTYEEVGELVRNDEGTEAVLKWLERHDINVLSKTTHGEYIFAEASVAVWEDALRAEMHVFQNQNDEVIRGLSFSLPEEIEKYVVHIHGFVDLPAPRGPPIIARAHHVMETDGVDSLEDINRELATGSITPINLRSIYNIDGSGDGYGSLAVYGSIGQMYNATDLKTFQSLYNLPYDEVDQNIGNLPYNPVCNWKVSVDDCIEANLDFQYILAVAQNVPSTYAYSSLNTSADFTTFFTKILPSANASMVYSVSYAYNELFVASGTLTAFDTEAAKAGVRGITIVAASGDDGAAGPLFRYGSLSDLSCGYLAQWPASSPYVTAVGATMNGQSLTGSDEITCSSKEGSVITSGGGFSHSAKALSWQTDAISSYLQKFTPAASGYFDATFNTANRGYPDISMPGNSYATILGGRLTYVSGTSASAPAFAGMVALINSNRLRYDKSVTTGLGFLNPTLYANDGFALNDITSGDNYCTAVVQSGSSSNYRCCTIGYAAKSGWDPVTGWGSVNYETMFSFYNGTSTGSTTSSPTSSSQSGSNTLTIILPAVLGGSFICCVVLVYFFWNRCAKRQEFGVVPAALQ